MTKEQDEVLELRGRVAALEEALASNLSHYQWLAHCTRGDDSRLSNSTFGSLSMLHAEFTGAEQRCREALAAAVPPKSPDVELYEAQERFVDARRSAAVPQSQSSETASGGEQSEPNKGVQEPSDAVAGSAPPPAHPRAGTDSGPAVPQPPRDGVDEAVETRAREAMIEPTSTTKLSGRWEGPATPEQAAECLAVLKGEPPKSKVDAFRGAILKALEDFDGR